MTFRECVETAVDVVLAEKEHPTMDDFVTYIEDNFPGKNLERARAGLVDAIRRVLKSREEVEADQLELFHGMRLQKCYAIGDGSWCLRRNLTPETAAAAEMSTLYSAQLLVKNADAALDRIQAFREYRARIEPYVPPGGTYGEAEDLLN